MCLSTLLIRIILDRTLVGGSAAFVALPGFFLQHAFRQQLSKTMLLVPLVICCQFMAGRNFLVTADLKLVQVRQVTFGSDMGKEM